MLGQVVKDPDGIEGSIPQLPGLGLLDIETTMTAEKTTTQVEFDFNGEKCKGYEIHQGASLPCPLPSRERVTDEQLPQVLERKDNDDSGKVLGTYVHGFLDNPSVINYILKDKAKETAETESIEDFKNRQYDLLADHVRKHVDIDKLYEIMNSKINHQGVCPPDDAT